MSQAQMHLFRTAWQHRLCHGGELRKSSHGRGARPLSSKCALHLVFKINRSAVKLGLRHPRNFRLVNEVIRQYRRKFFVKVEALSLQADHIHLSIRASKRSQFQSFFKVVAGQIAQRLTGTFHARSTGPRIWKHRPFTRVVRGFRAERVLRDYIQLNELEALGRRVYRKQRLRGFTTQDLEELWR